MAKNENWFVMARRFSVSKRTIQTWDIVIISWAFAWTKSCNFYLGGWDVVRKDALWYHVIITGYKWLNILQKHPKEQEEQTWGITLEEFANIS